MAQSVKSFVKTTKTARYFSLNSVQPLTENIWIVFHGYGQLAEYFIKHFENLDPGKNFIIAPEGLSKFYVEGLSGRVGASWMTKEDREIEIEDQSEYVNAVLADSGINPASGDHRIVVLGFSQGTATAVRWCVKNAVRPSELILWAGSFPHDVDSADHQNLFDDLSTHFAYGREDQFLQHINVMEKTAEFEKMGMTMNVWPFNGKHTMDKPTLDQIVNSFAS